MKHRSLLWIMMLICILASCSTDVELYADYKDVAVIYGMLNPRSDTNIIKITRAFCGSNDNPINASEVALISDSSNYPGKLDARLVEFKSTHGGPFQPTDRVLLLDTMTIHHKEEGTFYSPDQLLYYTPEQIKAGKDGEKYRYRLIVVKPDGDTVTAITTTVGNEELCIVTGGMGFQLHPTNGLGRILFIADGVATLYEVKIQFNYREQLNGQAMKHKSVSRSFGTKTLMEYPILSGNSYFVEYSPNWLFNTLRQAIGGDTIVDINHPNVVRYIDDFVISISAGGEELNMYYLLHQAQNASPISPDFTNIDGGCGLFSSRTTIEKVARLSSTCKRDLFSVTSWGFKEQ